jgi:two-component system, NarL family, invasion response regulator UvrY
LGEISMTERKCIIASKFSLVTHSMKEIIKIIQPDLEIVTVNAVEEMILSLNPEQKQVIVFDSYFFGLFIEEEFKKIVRINSKVQFICVMDEICERYFGLRLIRSGCNSIICSKGNFELLLDQLRPAFRGVKIIPENVRDALDMREYLLMPDCIGSLSKRETGVLSLMVGGKSIKQICQKLGLAHGTVACMRSRIMKKLGATNSLDTVMIAVSYGYTNKKGFEFN